MGQWLGHLSTERLGHGILDPSGMFFLLLVTLICLLCNNLTYNEISDLPRCQSWRLTASFATLPVYGCTTCSWGLPWQPGWGSVCTGERGSATGKIYQVSISPLPLGAQQHNEMSVGFLGLASDRNTLNETHVLNTTYIYTLYVWSKEVHLQYINISQCF